MKRNRGHLSNKQRAVLNDLLKNGLTEQEALEKHNITPRRYRKWLKNGLFEQEINARIDAAIRQSRLVMAHCLPWAAQRLVQLTVSEKDETARKACLDVISQHNDDVAQDIAENPQPQNKPPQISDEKASRMLAILAEDEKTGCEQPLTDNTKQKTCPPMAEFVKNPR